MFDPLAAAHTQENGQALEDLVRLNAEDDQGYGQLPDEGGQERKGHDDRIDADGVKEQGEFGISAPAQDAVADGHLVGHADHDKAHDHHDLIRQPQGVGRQAVVGIMASTRPTQKLSTEMVRASDLIRFILPLPTVCPMTTAVAEAMALTTTFRY